LSVKKVKRGLQLSNPNIERRKRLHNLGISSTLSIGTSRFLR